VKGTTVGVWPGLRSGFQLGSGRERDPGWNRERHRQAICQVYVRIMNDAQIIFYLLEGP